MRKENEMSREIVFRGKRIDGEGWVYGSFIRWFDGTTSIEPGEYEEPMYAVHPDTVGQWTGLTDKNGKRIFEGDILKWDSDEYGSEYNEICSWDYELLDMRKNDWKEWCEVVGNIHDGLELIGGPADEKAD